MAFVPPTEKQMKYAIDISSAFQDDAPILEMDKWQMRDYISKALESQENRKKIHEHTGMMMRLDYERQVAAERKERERQERCRRNTCMRSERENETTISRYFTEVDGRWVRKEQFSIDGDDEDYYGDRDVEPDVFG